MTSAKDEPGASILLTRRETIRLCRVAPPTFDKYVRPKLHEVRIGARIFFQRTDLEAVLSTPNEHAPARVTPGPRGPRAKGLSRQLDRQTAEIVERMRARAVRRAL
jgi:hypothetical protein